MTYRPLALIAISLCTLFCATTLYAENTTTQALPEDVYARIAVIERKLPENRSVADFTQLAKDYRITGRPSDAYVQIQLALSQAPNDVAALTVLGELQIQRKEFKQALATFDHVAKLQPNDAYAQLGRSQAMVGMGKIREADAASTRYRTLQKQAAEQAK